MAKARTTDVPALNDPITDRSSQTALAGPTVVSLAKGSRSVQIEIPLTGQPPPTEFGLHVDCKLTPQQATVLRRIALQLDNENACLNNGQRIVNITGALKWVLEQTAKQLE